MALFTPTEGVKKRGEKQVGGAKCLYFQNYIDVFARKTVHKQEKKEKKTTTKRCFPKYKEKDF